MGNTVQRPTHDPLQIIDQRYGGSIQLQRQNGKIMAVATIPVPTKAELEEMMTLILKRTRLSHKNLSTIRSYRIEKDHSFCTEYASLSMYFEYFENDLEKDIERRALTNQPYTQPQILKLLLQITDCLKYLHQHHCFHGNIKSNNILITPNHTLKLLDSYFTHLGKTNLQLVATAPQTIAYLSPSQLTKLRRGDYSKDDDIERNQVFSLGMLMIQLMSLEHSYECYEFSVIRIREDVLQERVSRLKGRYTEGVVELVGRMVEVDEGRRLGFREILRHRVLSNKISVSRAISEHTERSLLTNRTTKKDTHNHHQLRPFC